MALRHHASTTRLAVLTLLVGLAAAALGPRAADPSPARSPGPAGWVSVALIAVLTIAALTVVVIAGIRYRPRRRSGLAPVREHRPAGNPWLGAMILLGLLAIAVAPPWFLVTLGILAIVLAAAALGYRRRTPPAAPEPSGGTPLATVVERALRAVATPAQDPKTAIINCYAAMEDALAELPGAAPRPADSPTEVLDRATSAGAVRSPSAWRLVELFDEARFSAHPMTEPDRTAAESCLRLILADLGGPP